MQPPPREPHEQAARLGAHTLVAAAERSHHPRLVNLEQQQTEAYSVVRIVDALEHAAAGRDEGAGIRIGPVG